MVVLMLALLTTKRGHFPIRRTLRRCQKRPLLTLVLLLAVESGVALAADPFTVADSIGMTRLSDPDTLWADLGYQLPEFNVAPDGERLIVVTRRGNLETGLNEYQLRAYAMKDIRAFLSSGSNALPPYHVAVQFESASIQPAIDHVGWLDRDRVAFIGRGVDKIGQVYWYDFRKNEVSRLTASPHNIARYAISDDGNVVVYSAETPPDWKDRNEHGYAVESQFVASLAWTEPSQAVPELRYFALDRRTAQVVPANMEAVQYLEHMFISPSGDQAVVVQYPSRMPKGWERYEPVASILAQAAQAGAIPVPGTLNGEAEDDWVNEAFGTKIEFAPQALLFDTKSGQTRPLLDAPLSPYTTLFRAQWSPDGTRLLFGPTFLPLSSESTPEAERRAHREAIAELDLRTGGVTRVIDFSPDYRATRFSLVGDDRLEIHYYEISGHVQRPKIFLKRSGAWVEAKSARLAQKDAVQFSIVQGMNVPPEIFAAFKGGRRAITNLNPRLKELTLARVQTFEWKDRLGRKFQGGLFLPPKYDAGRRYPVVLQGGGFDPNVFMVDGYAGLQTAYAAQALANIGILVLQLPRRPIDGIPAQMNQGCEHWQDCGEAPAWSTMVEGAIDALDKGGFSDRERVGAIGFSRVGMLVHHLVTFSKYSIAAATISDSIAATPPTYAFVYGFSYPGMLEFERDTSMGAPFWGEGIKLWQERSPAFHLDRVKTPLRIEFIGKGLSAYWDTFANLKRHRRPVELIHIPLDMHVLQTPFGRYTSLQGNVDWFRFWLLGEEDPDARKADQYRRWQKLRRQHEQSSGALSAVQ